MEKEQLEPNNYYQELKWLFLLLFISFNFSCQSNELEKMQDEGRSKYEDGKFEIGMQDVEFNGPIVLKLINGVQTDTNIYIFGWYYVHERDTFWIYSYVDKNSNKKRERYDTGIGYSDNIDELRSNWKKWASATK